MKERLYWMHSDMWSSDRGINNLRNEIVNAMYKQTSSMMRWLEIIQEKLAIYAVDDVSFHSNKKELLKFRCWLKVRRSCRKWPAARQQSSFREGTLCLKMNLNLELDKRQGQDKERAITQRSSRSVRSRGNALCRSARLYSVTENTGIFSR